MFCKGPKPSAHEEFLFHQTDVLRTVQTESPCDWITERDLNITSECGVRPIPDSALKLQQGQPMGLLTARCHWVRASQSFSFNSVFKALNLNQQQQLTEPGTKTTTIIIIALSQSSVADWIFGVAA